MNKIKFNVLAMIIAVLVTQPACVVKITATNSNLSSEIENSLTINNRHTTTIHPHNRVITVKPKKRKKARRPPPKLKRVLPKNSLRKPPKRVYTPPLKKRKPKKRSKNDLPIDRETE